MKKIFLLAIVGLLLSVGVNAQKFGYVNSEEILATMPDMIKAQKDLETYSKTFEPRYKEMAAELQSKYDAYIKKGNTMTDAERTAKETELNSLKERMDKYETSTDQQLKAKQETVLKPVFEKAQKAIKDYAVEKGYDYIFDAKTIVYAKESDDLTPMIKAKLGAK